MLSGFESLSPSQLTSCQLSAVSCQPETGSPEIRDPMRIAVTGATGLIGRELCRNLRADGVPLTLLVRRPEKVGQTGSDDRVERWEATQGPPRAKAFEGVDAVVHLAGAGIADRRWTDRRKTLLRSSRVDATRHLVEALAALPQSPDVLVSGSAIGIYGDRGDEPLTEDSPPGTGFLARLATEWEAQAEQAASAGMRVVLLRTGIVLARSGGALPEMVRPFRFFVGGPLGSGRQFLSWIHLTDEVGLIRHALESAELSGPLNAVAPAPVRQRDLATELGNLLRKPAFIRTPAWALRLALGEMAGPLLLEGQRVLPRRAQSRGFEFRFPELRGALEDILNDN